MIKQPHKLKAGALQFTTLIGVVIAVLLAAFILLTYTQLKFTKLLSLSDQLIQQSHDGIAYAKQKDIRYDQITQILLEGDFPGTLTIKQTHWGIFDKVISTATLGQKKDQKIALIGGQLSHEQRPALYLSDTNTPLVVVGETKIYGRAILPKQGVKAGNIAGNYYRGGQLTYGSRGVSSNALPTIPISKRLYYQNLLKKGLFVPDSLLISASSSTPKQRNFELPSQWLYRSGVIELSRVDLSGNLIIKSDTLIRVSAFAKAKNILLIAPRIEIAAKFNGQVQAIASKSIKVGISAQLKYPSALVLVSKEEVEVANQKELSGIQVEQRAHIEGSILYLNATESQKQEAAVQLMKDSRLKGELYCEQTTELKGTVVGSVFTRELIAKAKGSLYKNHLFGATIDSRNFPNAFAGILTRETEKTVVQWLD